MRTKVRLNTDSKARRLVRIRVQSMAVVLAVISAAGCTSQQQKADYALLSPSKDLLISAEAAGFLSDSAPGSSASFADSLWGQNVTIFAQAPYFSASGAKCRQLVVENTTRHTELACTLNNQEWYKARALTARAVQ